MMRAVQRWESEESRFVGRAAGAFCCVSGLAAEAHAPIPSTK
jgi:hypothetical protein